MSEPTGQTTETTTTETTTETATASWDEAFKGEDPAKVRKALDHAREWEKRAKENAKAAERLKELEDAQKSDAEKTAERLRETEARALAAERDALRFKVAAKFQIGDEDADLFLTGSDEETLTKQAERLTARAKQEKKQGNVVPREGQSTAGVFHTDERTAVRELFGSG